MRNDTRQWANKAEDDFRVAERELGVADLPSYDATGFDATLPAAQEALAAATRVRAHIHSKLGL